MPDILRACIFLKDSEAESQIGLMASIIRGVRDARQNLNISPKAGLSMKLLFLSDIARQNFGPIRAVAQTIGSITEVTERAEQAAPKGYVPFKFDDGLGYLSIPSDIDANDIATKLTARISHPAAAALFLTLRITLKRGWR